MDGTFSVGTNPVKQNILVPQLYVLDKKNWKRLMGRMKGIDTLPPGPINYDYKFEIVYYYQPLSPKYKEIIVGRLLQGVPQSMAGEGLPVTFNAVKMIARGMGITHKHAKKEHYRIGNNTMKAYDVVEAYLIKKLSIKAIAKLAGCSNNKILSVLDEMNVKDRLQWRNKNRTKRMLRLGHTMSKIKHVNKGNPTRAYHLKRWRESVGRMLIPVYNDYVNGMNMLEACRKHGVCKRTAQRNFDKLQNKYLAYLDWGRRYPMRIYLTKARLKQWEWVAKQTHNNVLDWLVQVVNVEADRHDNAHARNQSGKHSGHDSGKPAQPQGEDAGGEAGAVHPSL